MNNIEEEIKDLIRKGYDLKEIYKISSIGYWETFRIKNRMEEEGKLTREDFAEGRKNKKIRNLTGNPLVLKILKYKRLGMSDFKISKMSDIEKGKEYVSYYIRESVSVGLITKEEIKEAKKIRSKIEKEILDGEKDIDISKEIGIEVSDVSAVRKQIIDEGVITQEELDRIVKKREKERIKEKQEREKYNLDKKRILICLKQGQTCKFISENTEMGINYIKKIRDQLIDDGLITKEEMMEARIIKKELEECGVIDKKIEGVDEEELLSYLILGCDEKHIRKKMGIDNIYKCKLAIYKLIYDMKITKREIEEYRENKKKKDKEIIFESLKKGISKKQIYQELEMTWEKACRYIEEIKNEKNISEKDILEWKREKNRIEKEIKENKAREEKRKEIEELEQSIAKKENTVEYRNQNRFTVSVSEKEDNSEQMLKFNQLKREINSEIKTRKEPTEEKKDKLREYIDLCFEIYKDKKITKIELECMKQAMQKIIVTNRDIIRFARQCIVIGEYDSALSMIKNRSKLKRNEISEKEEKRLSDIQNTLVNACKINEAIQIIKRGNNDTEVLCKITGLSKDEINILKIKLLEKNVKIRNVSGREKILCLMSKSVEFDEIQKKIGITDFEMEDIKEQIEYRRVKGEERNFETQVKQDSTTRIIVLLTKIGNDAESISNMFNIEIKYVEEAINDALTVGLIKKDQLQGIDLLKKQSENIKEIATGDGDFWQL